jgi:hypothetical protein
MSHLDIDTVLGWRGRTVRDSAGEKAGTFGDVFLDRQTDRPAWGSVRTGLFGRHESFVPLEAVREGEGGDIEVPYTKAQLEEAPRIDPDVALDEEEERRLYAHYGQEYAHIGGDEPGAVAEGGERAGEGRASAGEPLGEGEMIRSEEEVRVSEGPMRPTERVRLRKVLVTEQQERTIPVRREVVQLETEPAPEGVVEEVHDAGAAPPPDERR